MSITEAITVPSAGFEVASFCGWNKTDSFSDNEYTHPGSAQQIDYTPNYMLKTHAMPLGFHARHF